MMEVRFEPCSQPKKIISFDQISVLIADAQIQHEQVFAKKHFDAVAGPSLAEKQTHEYIHVNITIVCW